MAMAMAMAMVMQEKYCTHATTLLREKLNKGTASTRLFEDQICYIVKK